MMAMERYAWPCCDQPILFADLEKCAVPSGVKSYGINRNGESHPGKYAGNIAYRCQCSV